MATNSSILAWRIPWTKEPGRLQSTGLQSPTWLRNFTFFSLFLSFKRESCTKAPVGHLHFPLEGSNKPGHKSMSSREEPNWFLSVKRAEQGDAHVWEQGETWHFHKCPELLGVTSLKILPGLGARLSSSLQKSLRRWRRQIFLFPSHEEEWHSDSLLYLLSILSLF